MDKLPSRFQIGEEVRALGRRGTVMGVSFAMVPFDPDYIAAIAEAVGSKASIPTHGAKVLYDVLTKTGLHQRVLSNDVEPADRLRVVS